MSRLLIEPAMPFGPKFASGPELAVSLHFKALCHSALMLTDGFIAADKPYELVKARRQDVEKAIKHLTTTQPGCDNPSWEERLGGWFLHDYDDPIYANPLRETVRTQQLARTKSAAAAGKASARVRRERFGTAQPPRVQPSNDSPNDSFERPFGDQAKSEMAPSNDSPNDPSRTARTYPAMRSTNTDVHGVEEHVLTKHGDTVTDGANGPARPSLSTQAVRISDWLLMNRGDHTFGSREEQVRELATATQMLQLGLSFPDVMSRLEQYRDAMDPDAIASSLSFYYGHLQDEAHTAMKAPRAHTRTDGLTKIAPSTPAQPQGAK
jgi:hypothetical protein